MLNEQQTPHGIDVNTPNAARMYDYYLGGDNNFPADREAAERVLRAAPWIRATALENRAFMGRAVRHLAEDAGIRQFIDVGAGLPTQGNAHEIAQRVDPEARVVYVDNDPVVLGHSRALLARNANTVTLRADLREPAAILSDAAVNKMIDWSQPVAVMMVAVLHFVVDEYDPAGIVGQFRDVMAPGSHIVMSHIYHPAGTEALRRVLSVYQNANAPLVARTDEEIKGLFNGFDLLEPGLVPLQTWRPVSESGTEDEILGLGGVGVLSRG